MSERDKRVLQESQYEYPYHYLPMFGDDNVFRVHQSLAWGIDYMTYMSFVCDLVRRRAPHSLLDVGCGDGRLAHMIKSSIPHVTGVDLSEQAIGFARAFNPNVEFMCADIDTLSGKYTCVTLIEVLEHIPDPEIPDFLRVLAGLLQHDGWLVICVPTVNMPVNKKHYRHYDLSLLRTTVEAYFEVEEHWWLSRRSTLARMIQFSMCNRLYVLNHKSLLRLLWRAHKRWTYHADDGSARHLVCVARLRNNTCSAS